MAIATALTVAVLKAQGFSSDWPTKAPYDNAIHAFDLALTKAAHDPAFRDRLKNPATAKAAVAEVGNIRIPDDRVILFYEAESLPTGAGQGVAPDFAKMRRDAAASLAWDSRSNEKVHVFVLPKPNADATKQYRYEDYFMCCYDYWKRSSP